MIKALDTARGMLSRWAEAVEPMWYRPPGAPGLACFGSGYVHWGVQANLNVAGALATLAVQPGASRVEHWRDRAIAALRFALATHHTGERAGTNGEHWGRSWISVLGLERSMHAIAHLRPHLADADHAALRRVLLDEARWLLHEGQRHGHRDVHAGLWNNTGRNSPESNIWNGCFLWRVSRLFPDEPDATPLAERAHDYLVNGVSVPADAHDATVVAGRPVRDRHVGANFFPAYALDHHGYLNVGYMAVCVSNAAMLHFDARLGGFEAPASLHHHQADLWAVIRRMLFPDGRLCRIGGDSRIRYAYAQEYVLPALLYAADHLGDAHAPQLAAGLVRLMQQEHDASGDGSFYHARLGHLAAANPHYYARLESDRAAALAMLLNYAPLAKLPAEPDQPFTLSVAGGWDEPEHGAILHRGPHRLAAFAWRAHGLTQATALPPDRSDLAEWESNLCPVVRFLGDREAAGASHRRLLRHWQQQRAGGFVTCGAVTEGVNLSVDEGAKLSDVARTDIAFAALPDGRTCVGLQRVIMAPDRMAYAREITGLNLNIPNDVFNGRRRRLTTAAGEHDLVWPPAEDALVGLRSDWAHLDAGIGVAAIYGGPLTLDRSPTRRGGRYASLAVERLCLGVQRVLRRCEPGETLLDVGFAVICDPSSGTVSQMRAKQLHLPDGLRGVEIAGTDGVTYRLTANFGDDEAEGIPPGAARLTA